MPWPLSVWKSLLHATSFLRKSMWTMRSNNFIGVIWGWAAAMLQSSADRTWSNIVQGSSTILKSHKGTPTDTESEWSCCPDSMVAVCSSRDVSGGCPANPLRKGDHGMHRWMTWSGVLKIYGHLETLLTFTRWAKGTAIALQSIFLICLRFTYPMFPECCHFRMLSRELVQNI